MRDDASRRLGDERVKPALPAPVTRASGIASRLLLPLGLALVWGAFYAHHGYSGRDEGLIVSLAWRVAQGQWPYRDFILVLPPVSVLLHTIPQLLLPLEWLLIFERYLFFLIIATYSRVTAAALGRTFDLGKLGVGQPLLTVLFFVVSTANFPPMPWPTTDGILLCAVGSYALLRVGRRWTLAATLLFFLGALCKQSFAFMLPASLVYLLVVGRRRDAWTAVSAYAVMTAAFASALVAGGLFREFLAQVSVQSSLRSLINSGLLNYFRFHAAATVPAFLAAAALVGLSFRFGARLRSAAPYVLLLGIFGIQGYGFVTLQRFQTPTFNYAGFLMLICLPLVALDFRTRRRQAMALLLLLTLSWCASLSWGFQSPLLFSAPILFCLLLHSRRRLTSSSRTLAAATLVAAMFVQYLGYQFPYAEPPRTRLDQPLSRAFARLRGIYSSPERLAGYQELKRLHDTYGDNYVVYPGVTLSHFLTDTGSPARLDWAFFVQTDYAIDTVVRELEEQNTTVFIEVDSPYLCAPGRSCSALVEHVTSRWQAVERGEYFTVYRAASSSSESGGPASAM